MSMSLLFDIALLQRPGRLDVLSALRDAPVIRDRRDDVELFREIAKRIGGRRRRPPRDGRGSSAPSAGPGRGLDKCHGVAHL